MTFVAKSLIRLACLTLIFVPCVCNYADGGTYPYFIPRQPKTFPFSGSHSSMPGQQSVTREILSAQYTFRTVPVTPDDQKDKKEQLATDSAISSSQYSSQREVIDNKAI